jgi:hypothetical protein
MSVGLIAAAAIRVMRNDVFMEIFESCHADVFIAEVGSDEASVL